MTVTLRKLRKGHHTLMTQYIDLLNQASKLPFFAPITFPIRKQLVGRSLGWTRWPEAIGFPIALRYLVRLFTESHIRGKLMELSVAYSFFALQNPEDKRLVTWLKETSADCDKLAATLTSWQSVRGIVSGLWPVGIGIATALLNLENIYDVVKRINVEPVDWVTVGLVIFPLIYVIFFIGSAFQKKREMFLRGFLEGARQMNADSSASIDSIVYRLEDQVFNQLGRGKVREFPLDVIGQASVFAGFAALAMTVWINEPPGLARNFFGIEVAIFLIAAIASLFQLRGRKWA
jgi:hypothetical protein